MNDLQVKSLVHALTGQWLPDEVKILDHPTVDEAKRAMKTHKHVLCVVENGAIFKRMKIPYLSGRSIYVPDLGVSMDYDENSIKPLSAQELDKVMRMRIG